MRRAGGSSSDADRERAFLFASWADARKEVDRRSADPAHKGFVNRVERAPYGSGYTVRSVPIDQILDEVVDYPGKRAGVGYDDL